MTSLANPESALAHAPPEITRILWSEDDGSVVLVANRGLVFGNPQRRDWSLMCGAAADVSFEERADYVQLSKGRLLAASASGLRATDNGGCDWRAVSPFEKLGTLALAQHPREPDTLYLSVFGPDQSSIQESRDGGKSWTLRHLLDDGESISEIVLSPSQPTRIYARGSSGAKSHFLVRSSDAGKSWEKLPLMLSEGEGEARLVAVSPTDPELLLLLALHDERGIKPDRLLLSRDGGESFTELFSDLELFDASFGSKGELVWVAGSYGLWRSNPALTEVAQIGAAQLMTCVAPHGEALFACGHHSGFDPAGAGVGVSDATGEAFEPWLAFPQIDRPIDCPADSATTRACDELWDDWKLEILVSLADDDGEPSAPDSAHADDTAKSDSSSEADSRPKAGGCASSMPPAAGLSHGCIAMLTALFARRRRRR